MAIQIIRLANLGEKDRQEIDSSLLPHFDDITFENRAQWIAKINDGSPSTLYRSFDNYSFHTYPDILEYINRDYYQLNYGDDISDEELQLLLSKTEYEYAVSQRHKELKKMIQHFDEYKIELLKQTTSLYFVYAKDDIQLVVEI